MCQGRHEDASRAFSQVRNIDFEYAQQLEQHCLNQGHQGDAEDSGYRLDLGPFDPYIGIEERLGDIELLMQARLCRYATIDYFLFDKGEKALPTSLGTWKVCDKNILRFSNPRMGDLTCRKVPLRASANRVGDLELKWLSPRFRVAAATKGFISPSEIVKVYRRAEEALANHHSSLKLSADPRIGVLQPRSLPLPWKPGSLGFCSPQRPTPGAWLLGFRKVQGPNMDVLLLALSKSEWPRDLSRGVAAGLIRKHLQDLVVFRQTHLNFEGKFRKCYEMKRRLVEGKHDQPSIWKGLSQHAGIDRLPEKAATCLERLGHRLEARASMPYRDAAPWNAVLDCVRLDLDLRQDWLPRDLADDYDFATPEGTAQWLNSLLPLMEQRQLSIESMADLFAQWLIQIDFDECYKIVPPELDLLLIFESFHLAVAYPELTTVLAAEAQREYELDDEGAWLETSFFMHSNMAHHRLKDSTDPETDPELDYHIQCFFWALARRIGCGTIPNLTDYKNGIIKTLELLKGKASPRSSRSCSWNAESRTNSP
jgi:hypothetical protein